MTKTFDYQATVKKMLADMPILPKCDFTYKEMERLLEVVGLSFSQVTVKRNQDFWEYKCSLETLCHPISICFYKPVAVYSTCATSNCDSVDEVVKQLFEEAMFYKIYVGGYGQFSEVIEWNNNEQEFARRELTEEEKMSINTDY